MWSIIVGAIIDPVVTLIRHSTLSAKDKAEIEAELRKVRVEQSKRLAEVAGAMMKEKAELVKSETEGRWYQRLWRPLFMYLFWFMLLQEFVLFPWMRAIGLPTPEVILPDQIWTLITIGFSGYMVARTVEKKMPNIDPKKFPSFGLDKRKGK